MGHGCPFGRQCNLMLSLKACRLPLRKICIDLKGPKILTEKLFIMIMTNMVTNILHKSLVFTKVGSAKSFNVSSTNRKSA